MPVEAKKLIFFTQIDHLMQKLGHQFVHLGNANQSKPTDN